MCSLSNRHKCFLHRLTAASRALLAFCLLMSMFCMVPTSHIPVCALRVGIVLVAYIPVCTYEGGHLILHTVVVIVQKGGTQSSSAAIVMLRSISTTEQSRSTMRDSHSLTRGDGDSKSPPPSVRVIAVSCVHHLEPESATCAQSEPSRKYIIL